MPKKKEKRTSKSDIFFTLSFMIAISLLIAVFLGYLWVHNSVTTTIKENVALRRMEEKLDNRNRELKSQIRRLSRGDRIKRIAREDLGMVIPEPESLVVLFSEEIK